MHTRRSIAASSAGVAPWHDRDLRADVRIAHPLISRAHLVLRFDQGRWLAIDNGSLNGMFVNNRRVPAVDLNDGTTINIGNPDGPRIGFELGNSAPDRMAPVPGALTGHTAQRLDALRRLRREHG